jgi:HSP20 family molecular chaperone IbpA
MRVIRWEPFRDMDDVFDRFFAETMRRWPRQAAGQGQAGEAQQGREWAPVADVSETDGEYLIKAELPEVRKEDVSITVQDGVLTLAASAGRKSATSRRRSIASSGSTARSRAGSRCRRTPMSRASGLKAATA